MRSWNELVGTIAWPDKMDAPIPTFWPENDNTHLYFSYMLRLYRPFINSEQYSFIHNELIISGLKYRRWRKPNTVMSHDEVLGFGIYCYLMRETEVCGRFLKGLRDSGGLIDDPENPNKWTNVFRIVYLEGVLAACCKEKMTPIQQLAFALSCLMRCFSKRGHASPFLRVWVCVPVASLFPLSSLGLVIFSIGMKIRRYTLKEAFTQYFSKVPQLAELGSQYGWLD